VPALDHGLAAPQPHRRIFGTGLHPCHVTTPRAKMSLRPGQMCGGAPMEGAALVAGHRAPLPQTSACLLAHARGGTRLTRTGARTIPIAASTGPKGRGAVRAWQRFRQLSGVLVLVVAADEACPVLLVPRFRDEDSSTAAGAKRGGGSMGMHDGPQIHCAMPGAVEAAPRLRCANYSMGRA
jgi:hypothetical protein